MHQSMRLIIKEGRFSKFVPRDSPSSLKICSLTLDRSNSNGDDMMVEDPMMAMRLLGNFGRYGVKPLHIL
jgi:hypothetical protein